MPQCKAKHSPLGTAGFRSAHIPALARLPAYPRDLCEADIAYFRRLTYARHDP